MSPLRHSTNIAARMGRWSAAPPEDRDLRVARLRRRCVRDRHRRTDADDRRDRLQRRRGPQGRSHHQRRRLLARRAIRVRSRRVADPYGRRSRVPRGRRCGRFDARQLPAGRRSCARRSSPATRARSRRTAIRRSSSSARRAPTTRRSRTSTRSRRQPTRCRRPIRASTSARPARRRQARRSTRCSAPSSLGRASSRSRSRSGSCCSSSARSSAPRSRCCSGSRRCSRRWAWSHCRARSSRWTRTISAVILLIGLAVGVDYSLFYIRRERDERRAGRSESAALEAAAATSGRAVLISGITVMIAMAGMFFSGDKTFMSFAIGTMLVVAVAMLGSLTVLPAMLSWLGDRVDKVRVPVRLASQAGRRRAPGLGRDPRPRPPPSAGLGDRRHRRARGARTARADPAHGDQRASTHSRSR